MNGTDTLTRHAIRVGISRGWTEFTYSLRNPQDLMFYMFMGVGALVYLFLNRNSEFGDTGLALPEVAFPSILAGMVVFGSYIGPLYALTVEREDGTLLRAKAVPRGITGYVTGQVTLQVVSALPLLTIVIVPSLFLFDGITDNGVLGWVLALAVIALGMLTVLPLGMVVGSVLKRPNQIGTWGMLPMIALLGTSGIFYPVAELWGWLQVVVQVFPMYWLGHGMRAALLPDGAAVAELHGSWQLLPMLGVLAAWAMLGLLLAPVVLRRMARRQSGSAVEQSKLEAMQRIS